MFEYCQSCNPSYARCIKCVSGYFLNETGFCEPCEIANCQVCLSKTICQSCAKRHYLVQAQNTSACLKCTVESCIICQQLGEQCSECELGYYLADETRCLPCGPQCLLCTTSARDCKLCQSGYHLSYQQDCVKDKLHLAIPDYSKDCAAQSFINISSTSERLLLNSLLV